MEIGRWDDAPEEPAELPEAVDATLPALRGLIWVGVLALAFGLARAGWERAFVPGWWRQW